MKFYILVVFSLVYSSIVSGQITEEWNLNFEKWAGVDMGTNLFDTIIENHTAMMPYNWYFDPENISSGKGIGRTTNSFTGDYAVTLSGYYLYPVMRITTGSHPNKSGWPIDYRPKELKGKYKAILLGTNSDSLLAYVDIYLTKFNKQNQKRDTIGQGHIVLHETTNEYLDFNMPIDYQPNNQNLPDSITIILAIERFGFPINWNECKECSHVYFDDLLLPKSTTSISMYESFDEEFECYPNPTASQLKIKNNSSNPKPILIYDAYGIILYNQIIELKSEITIQLDKRTSSVMFVTDGKSTRKILVLE